jgi:hypothetical protein
MTKSKAYLYTAIVSGTLCIGWFIQVWYVMLNSTVYSAPQVLGMSCLFLIEACVIIFLTAYIIDIIDKKRDW